MIREVLRRVSRKTYGGFLKWWYPQNTPKWSFLVGKPMVVGETQHFRKHPYSQFPNEVYLCSPLPCMPSPFHLHEPPSTKDPRPLTLVSSVNTLPKTNISPTKRDEISIGNIYIWTNHWHIFRGHDGDMLLILGGDTSHQCSDTSHQPRALPEDWALWPSALTLPTPAAAPQATCETATKQSQAMRMQVPFCRFNRPGAVGRLDGNRFGDPNAEGYGVSWFSPCFFQTFQSMW